MARGQPDFGMYAPKTTVGSLSDMAELAVRLGSIDSYDRRGDVILLDDFEGTVLKCITGGMAGSAVALDATSVRSGSQAVKLTLAAVAASEVWIRKDTPVLISLRIGIEISFSVPATTYTFHIISYHYDGTNEVRGQCRLDFNAKELRIWDNALGWVLIASGLNFISVNHTYHTIKLVCDFSTSKFVRVMLNGTDYDISAYTLRSALSVTVPILRVEPTVVDNGGGIAASIWLDDLIFTMNEP